MYPWQAVYDEAVLETDPAQMRSRIEAANRAIELRQQEFMRGASEMPEERQAMESALGGLAMLKQERLNGDSRNGNHNDARSQQGLQMD